MSKTISSIITLTDSSVWSEEMRIWFSYSQYPKRKKYKIINIELT